MRDSSLFQRRESRQLGDCRHLTCDWFKLEGRNKPSASKRLYTCCDWPPNSSLASQDARCGLQEPQGIAVAVATQEMPLHLPEPPTCCKTWRGDGKFG